MYIQIGGFELDPFGKLAMERAVQKYDKALASHHALGAKVQKAAEELYELRSRDCKAAVEVCEAYVSRLANSPREFSAAVGELSIGYQDFTEVQEKLAAEAKRVSVQASNVAGTATAVGTSVAAFAPSAAMAIATTFGTASTGAAISGLGGAAATNAALAWLGGGALAAGGGGMAAGNALLALSGPVGWAIGGAGLIGAALMIGGTNGKTVAQAYEQLGKIEEDRLRLERAKNQVDGLHSLTQTHVAGVRDQLSTLESEAPQDYLGFGRDDRDRLKALINNVRSLAALMNERINPEEAATSDA